MKNLYNIILILTILASTWVGCSTEDTLMEVDLENIQEENAIFSVNMNLSVSDPIKVTSRNAEYDAIESMTLLCFNSQGKLISISTPTLDKENRTLTADITYTTRVIHLVANQTISGLNLGSSTEIEIANMVSTAERMIYWARVEIPSSVQGRANIESWFNRTFNAQNPILLLRNQAKVSISSENDDEGLPYFVVTEFKVYNTWNKGTVTPYHQTKNAFPTITDESFGLKEWAKENYIRKPTTDPIEKITIGDNLDDNIISPLYVYETEYSDNTFIVFRGYNLKDGPENSKWWRVAFKDSENKSLNIRRNHHYEVTITGRLLTTLGYDDITAVESPGAKTVNDVLDVSPEITSISNGKETLTVDDTEYVLINNTQKCEFNFNIKKNQSAVGDIKKELLEVMWDDEADTPQNISDLTNLTEYTGTDEEFFGYKLTCINYNEETDGYEEIGGKISIPLNSIGSDGNFLNGVVKIVYNNRLQRKINIKVVKREEFAEVNVEALEPEDSYKDPIATLNFNIPETYQGEYPFNVYITAGEFNLKKHINPEEGEVGNHDNCSGLSLVFPGDVGFPETEDNSVGYKYVYLVTEPGKHSVDMIFNGIVKDEGYTIKLQSDFFETKVIDNISLNRPTTD